MPAVYICLNSSDQRHIFMYFINCYKNIFTFHFCLVKLVSVGLICELMAVHFCLSRSSLIDRRGFIQSDAPQLAPPTNGITTYGATQSQQSHMVRL